MLAFLVVMRPRSIRIHLNILKDGGIVIKLSQFQPSQPRVKDTGLTVIRIVE
jgi:DNA-binding transcriptional ArsR family regulator